MNSSRYFAVAAILWAAIAAAQTAKPQPPPSVPDTSTANAQKVTPERPCASSDRANALSLNQRAQQIRSRLVSLRALLNSMRAAYATVDSRSQPAMQANIEMWQLLLDQLDDLTQPLAH
jgi:hypothetical protein